VAHWKQATLVIKLNGIVASKAEAQCQDKQGKNWPCGAAAKTALRRLIRARAVVCDLPATAEQKSFTTRCAVSGTDRISLRLAIQSPGLKSLPRRALP